MTIEIALNKDGDNDEEPGEHWFKGGEALTRADRKWLAGLITRREKPENFKQALDRKPDDIKVIIQFSDI